MKSIKEKAEEYDRVIKRINANESIVDVSGREQFVAGANYVLEQLEEFLNLCGNYCITSSAKAYLEDIIEQLKK